jgi:hypothetical protein
MYKTHKRDLSTMENYLSLNVVVRKVTARLQMLIKSSASLADVDPVSCSEKTLIFVTAIFMECLVTEICRR